MQRSSTSYNYTDWNAHLALKLPEWIWLKGALWTEALYLVGSGRSVSTNVAWKCSRDWVHSGNWTPILDYVRILIFSRNHAIGWTRDNQSPFSFIWTVIVNSLACMCTLMLHPPRSAGFGAGAMEAINIILKRPEWLRNSLTDVDSWN